MATLASATSSMASLSRQGRKVGSGHAVSNAINESAEVGDAHSEEGKGQARPGRRGRKRGRRSVEGAYGDMEALVLRQLQGLQGTLTTLRMLSSLATARTYVVKAEGAGAAASFKPSFLVIMSRSIEVMVSEAQPALPVDRLEAEHPACPPTLEDMVARSSSLEACVWNALTVAANLATEQSFIDELVTNAGCLGAVGLALAADNPFIASAAAGVVAAMASSGHARHKLLTRGQGFVQELMARCRVGEIIHLRSAAMQALHALVRGPEARQHLHSLKRLLTRDSLLALGAACLTPAHDKLKQLEAAIGGCDVVQVVAEVEQASAADAIILDGAPPGILDEITSCAESVVRLREALAELNHEQTSLPLISPPALLSAERTSLEGFGLGVEDIPAHADSLLKASGIVVRVAIEQPKIERGLESLCCLRDYVDKLLRSRRAQQRLSERLVTAAHPSVALILEDETSHLQDEDAKVVDLTRVAELLGQHCRCLLAARNELLGLRLLGAAPTVDYLAALALLVEEEKNREFAKAKGESEQNDGDMRSGNYEGSASPRVRLVRQLGLLSGLYAVNDKCKESVLGFMHCILALDQDLAKHAASNGLLELFLRVVKVCSSSSLPTAASLIILLIY